MSYNNINTIIKARQYTYSNNRYRGIISHLAQTDTNKKGSTTPLINNLEIIKVFKNKDEEERINIIDFIR